MKKPIVAKDKNLKQRHRNEKGSATLFVLIAMLFFITLGVMLFIRVSNNSGAQRKDVLKIQSEYNSNNYTDDELEKLYEEAKNSQVGKFLIKVIDSYQETYHSGDWINSNNDDRLPLTVEANWPEGIATITIEDSKNGKIITVNNKEELKNLKFSRGDEGQYIITGKTSSSSDETKILVRIDYTAPTIEKPAGGVIWIISGETTSSEIKRVLNITDNVSGVDKVEYIIASETPAADAQWNEYQEGQEIKFDSNTEPGDYYIFVRAVDKAGNKSEEVQSDKIQIRPANYEVKTGTTTDYAETLAEAVQKSSATDVSIIKPLKNIDNESSVTINKNVKIDTNGKTMTMADAITVASGKTATFIGTGTIQNNNTKLINNNGNLIINNATLIASQDDVIEGGNVQVNSGNLRYVGSNDQHFVIKSNNITISGGTITGLGYAIGSNQSCTISDGNITARRAIDPFRGTVNISGNATITGTLYGIVVYSGNTGAKQINISGGTITGSGDSAINDTYGIKIDGAGHTVNISGGTITGGKGGMYIPNSASNITATIGDNSNALDKTTPVITGTNGYSVNIESATSTFNFYDGKLIGGTKALASEEKRTYFGREVTFDVPNDATVNFLTETEANNVTRYYRPYTREKKDNNNVIYYETVLEKVVDVTFNKVANDATLTENSRKVLTNVEYKELAGDDVNAESVTYASLPIQNPENENDSKIDRTGYTFKGWNGKNLLNIQVPQSQPSDTAFEDTTKRTFKFNTYVLGYATNNRYSPSSVKTFNINANSFEYEGNNSGYGVGFPVRLKPNTNYVLTFNGTSSNGNGIISAVSYYQEDGTKIGNSTLKYTNQNEFKTPNDSNIYYYVVYIGAQKDTKITISDIQLEEGSTATAYEPYYIENDTKVVQDQDHTLNAIWEANEYTVHFNGDGSTAGIVEDQKFKYDEEKALNENKFERKYTVTYDGNEGTPAKANDTATYTFANWGNKDIFGYDIDMSDGNIYGGNTTFGNYNGYKTVSLDNTNGSSYLNILQRKVDRQFKTGDKYKLTFYAKGSGTLTTYFHGGDYSKVAVQNGKSSQETEKVSSDGNMPLTLTNEWTKYSVIYTMASTTDETISKYVLFRVFAGNSASIYGVRFEKLENEEHKDKAVVKNLTSEPNGEVTLYAVWTPHEVTLPTATRKGYIFNGWYDAATGGNKIGDAGDKYIPEADTRLYAQWRQVHYTILVGEENLVAETLEEAIKLAEDRITGSVTTATITATMNYNDNSTANITKNITIDTNGKTLTMADAITVASGKTATFEDTAETKGMLQRTTGDLITNNGNVVVTNATLQSNEYAINNNTTGTININGENALIIGTTGEAIDGTTGTVNINNGTIQGATYGLTMEANGTLNFNGGTIIGKTKALASEGKRTYFGREVTFDAPNDTTVNFRTETEGEATRYYRPYTRENTQTHLFETVLEKQVNVTFNPGEGATVAENNRNVLTNVEYKEKAEDATIVSLPRPEKTGYTFKGWNGKNLLNPDNLIEGRNIIKNNDGSISASDKTSDGRQWNYDNSNLKMSLPAGTYTLSLDFVNQTTSKYSMLRIYKDDGNYIKFNIPLNDVSNQTTTFTLNEETNIGIELKLYDAEVYMQLEKNNTATPYEPYYIENDTKVVQDQDHELKAIWEANDYTVHFNGDGSTAGTVEDQKFKYNEEKALNENKFERKYTVTYDGNEGTPAKADDTATYTFANWGNKDILGYDLDFSNKSSITTPEKYEPTYGNYNGYRTANVDATNLGDYNHADFLQWDVGNTFKTGDKYKLTFYAKGSGQLVTYFWGGNYSQVKVTNSTSSQGNTLEGQDGQMPFSLRSDWTKFSVEYTLNSTVETNITKKLMFRIRKGGNVSVYGVRFEKLENEDHQDKAVVKNLTSEPNGEVTLYAVWTPHEVTLPTATREGYIFNGWYDAAEGGNKIGDAGDKYIPEADTRLYAQWRQVHYTISVGKENLVAETLEEAIKLAEDRITGSVTTATITALMNYTDNSTATVSKNITIDLAGKTITLTNILTNNGTLEIKSIQENGKINRNGNVIINNRNTSSLTVSSGAITSTSGYGINNNANGNVTVAGGTVSSQSTIGIKNSSVGIINISGGSISGTHGVYNEINGTINVSNGTITATTGHGIRGYIGKVNVTGGTINGKTYGISVTQDDNNSGSLVIRGGSVISKGFGLYAGHGSSITIGDNDSTVSKETPMIESTATSGDYYGVSRESDATFNFYDGKIIGYDKHSLNKDVSNKPDKYKVFKRTIDGKEIAVLEKEVKVTFNKNAEDATCTETERNVLTNVEYQYNATTGENQTLPTPTRTGYTFKGWNGKNLLNIDEATVRNNYNGTYGVNARVENDRIILSGTNNKTDKNYSLINWKTNLPQLEVGKTYNLSVSENLENVYVQLNYINTSGEDKRLVFTSSSGIVTIPNDYTKTNYLFIGIDKNATTVNYNFTVQLEEGSTATAYEPYYITDNTKVVQDQDHELNAVWQATPYTVTLNAGDGTIDDGDDGWTRAGDNKTATKDITYDSNYGTLPTASRTGYEFDGWYTGENGTGDKVTKETKYTTDGTTTLHAKWTAKQYTVSFDPNGGTPTPASKSVTYDSTYGTLPTAEEVSKTGYTFKGWNKKNLFDEERILMAIEGATHEDGYYVFHPAKADKAYGRITGGINDYVGNKNMNISFKENTQYTLSFKGYTDYIDAVGECQTFFIGFFYTDGTSSFTGISTTNEGERKLTSTAGKTVSRIATSFGRGHDGANAHIKYIQLEEGTTATSYEPYYITAETKVTTASDHTLKAVWEPIPYTISYELNKGTNNSSNPTGYTIETENITLQNPTRNGYTFIGWTGSNGDTPQTTVTIPKGSTGNRTYTANWEEKTYTLTIKPNGGALDGSTTDVVRNLKYSDVSNINDPTRTGYSFGGYNELSGAAYNNGLASVKVYNNAHNDVVTVTPQAKSSDNPITGMSNELKISNSGTEETRPGLGGFLHSKHADANQKYVHVFVAKLPEGYYFHNANNSLGTGATKEWLTSNEGTGKWQTYVYQVNAGSSGTFNNFGYVYVSTDKDNVLGGSGRVETGAYTAYLAYSNIYDITSDDSGIGQIDGTGVLTAKWTAITYNITYNMDGGTNNASNPATYTIETPTINLKTPTKSGNTFFGWSVNEGENKLGSIERQDSNVTINNGTYTFTNETEGNRYIATKLQLWHSTQSFIKEISARNTNGKKNGIYDHKLNSGTYRIQFATQSNKKDASVFYNVTLEQGKKYYYEWENTKSTEQEYVVKNFKFVEAIGNKTASIPKGSTGDKEFTAYWYENNYTYRSYTATFNVNGGNELAEADRTRTLQYGTPLGALPETTRTGYDFAGWFTAATGGTQIFDATKMGAANVTYYAHWTAKQYTVTANANGGTIGTATGWTKASGNATATKSVTYDSQYGTLPTATRTGYTFKEWQIADNLISTNANDWQQGGIYDATGENSVRATRIRTDYIRVSPNTKYKLSVSNSNNILIRYVWYYDNNKTFINTNNTHGVVNTTEFTTPNNCYYIKTVLQYRDGETEITPSNVADANIYLTETVTDSTIVTQDQDHTLKAIWEANPYTVTFNKNGGTGTMANQSFVYDTAKALTANTFTRDDYSFMCWNTKADGSGDSYSNKEEVSNLTSEKNGNVTLYAQWTKFKLSTTEIYLNKTSPTNSIVIAPQGTSGANITYSGDNIGELVFNSTVADIVTVSTNSQNTQATVTATAGAADSATTVIEIKDKATGIKIGELTVTIDVTAPDWLINFFKITRR